MHLHLDYHLGNPKRYTAITFLTTLSTSLVVAILTLYLKKQGYSHQMIGVMLGIFPLVAIFGTPLMGILADQIGKRRILIYAALGQILALLFYLVGGSITLIITGRILDGLSSTTLALISLAKVEDLIKKDRSQKNGALLSLAHVGQLIGPPTALFLAESYFLEIPFIISITILAGILTLLIFTKEEHISHPAKFDIHLFDAFRNFFKNTRLKAQGIISITTFFSAPLMRGFVPLYIVETLGLTPTSVGLAILAFDAPYLLQFYFGTFVDKIRPTERIVLSSVFMLGTILLITGYSTTYSSLLPLLILLGIFGAFHSISTFHILSEIGEHAKSEATVLTIHQSIGRVGSLAGSLVSGVVFTTFGFAGLSSLSGLLMIFGSIVAYVTLKQNHLI